jgi:hypothetical protein
MNLDPALLDPEMSNYFFIHQSQDPPPHSEFEIQFPSQDDEYSHDMFVIDHPESLRMFHDDTSLQTDIAQPLFSPKSPDPLILSPPLAQSHSLELFGSSESVLPDDQSISISPSMLNKPVLPEDDVRWYSNGKEVQVGGKTPPHSKYCREGTGNGNVLGKRPSKTVDAETVTIPRGLGTRYEVNVDTGLDTVKRIKLVFHRDSPSTTDGPQAGSSSCKQKNLVDGDGTPTRGTFKEREARQDIQRVTPPAAIDIGRCLPTAKDLGLDENSPPPSSVSLMEKNRNVEVVIPEAKIDKSLYPVYLGKDARQTRVTSKASGRVKGIIFAW